MAGKVGGERDDQTDLQYVEGRMKERRKEAHNKLTPFHSWGRTSLPLIFHDADS